MPFQEALIQCITPLDSPLPDRQGGERTSRLIPKQARAGQGSHRLDPPMLDLNFVMESPGMSMEILQLGLSHPNQLPGHRGTADGQAEQVIKSGAVIVIDRSVQVIAVHPIKGDPGILPEQVQGRGLVLEGSVQGTISQVGLQEPLSGKCRGRTDGSPEPMPFYRIAAIEIPVRTPFDRPGFPDSGSQYPNQVFQPLIRG